MTASAACSTEVAHSTKGAAMPTSVRLDPETEALLEELTWRSGRSKSEVLREALHRLAESTGSGDRSGPYALISDLVGSARGGPATPAREHKKAYRAALTAKHRR